MTLKESLSTLTLGNQSVSAFLQDVKSHADELAKIDKPLADDDIALYVFNGLGPQYRDIAAAVRARETAITFYTLHDMLIAHEAYLKRQDTAASTLIATANNAAQSRGAPSPPSGSRGGNNSNHRYNNRGRSRGRSNGRGQFTNQQWNSGHQQWTHGPQPGILGRPPVVCQFYNIPGHTARTCNRIQVQAYVASPLPMHAPDQSQWLMDSGASHSLTSDLSNLSIHSEYEGPDTVRLAGGSGLKISHIGSSVISTTSRPL